MNSAHVALARKPASAIAWRSESSQWGSKARRRASAQPIHASNSTAATIAAAIAAVESVSECLAGVRLTACTVNVDCAGVAVVGAAVVTAGTPVVAPGAVVAVGVEDVTVAPAEVPGTVVVGDAVVVGTNGLAGVAVVLTDGLVVAPEVEGLAVVGCTLADAGIGKVGVELVGVAICR